MHYKGVQHRYSKIRKYPKSETLSYTSISDKGYRNVHDSNPHPHSLSLVDATGRIRLGHGQIILDQTKIVLLMGILWGGQKVFTLKGRSGHDTLGYSKIQLFSRVPNVFIASK
jgi:hypothetical protein